MRCTGLLLLGILFFSCTNGFHGPHDNEIKEAVINAYEERNERIGGDGWYIKEIKVLKSWKGNDERHYNAEVSVKGIRVSAPLPEEIPDENFNDTIDVPFIWRDGKWIIEE
jgi:hypothetical protein